MDILSEENNYIKFLLNEVGKDRIMSPELERKILRYF